MVLKSGKREINVPVDSVPVESSPSLIQRLLFVFSCGYASVSSEERCAWAGQGVGAVRYSPS